MPHEPQLASSDVTSMHVAPHIIDGAAPDSLLFEVFTGAGCGTMIVGRKEKATYLGVDLAALLG